ncbi:hypothetical protein [Bowmanella denitrificans]|uniref:hypothetical protein n=1 Tax=Bowmanella denitrificans TaxID=366582 RepID=UPI000C999BF4|nr:hypothetical protein [Bowmanella denitrificans]
MKQLILPFFMLLSGCSSVTIDEFRHSSASLHQGESIVILGRRHANNYETEPSLINCLQESMTKQGLNVIPEQQFLDEFYPFFEPRTAPLNLPGMNRLQSQERLASRMQQHKLRYLIWVDGNTETTSSVGSISCALVPGGGCLGFGSWDEEAGYESIIWDLKREVVAGRIHASAKGTSYMPAVVVPIPLLAQVETETCRGLGKQLTEFFKPQGETNNAVQN